MSAWTPQRIRVRAQVSWPPIRGRDSGPGFRARAASPARWRMNVSPPLLEDAAASAFPPGPSSGLFLSGPPSGRCPSRVLLAGLSHPLSRRSMESDRSPAGGLILVFPILPPCSPGEGAMLPGYCTTEGGGRLRVVARRVQRPCWPGTTGRGRHRACANDAMMPLGIHRSCRLLRIASADFRRIMGEASSSLAGQRR